MSAAHPNNSTNPAVDSRYEAGSVREVAVLAGPIIVSMLSFTVMGVADTLLVAKLGKAHVGAVGLATSFTMVINAFFMGLLMSTKILTSQRIGAQREHEIREIGWTSFAIAIAGGLGVTLFCLISPRLFVTVGGSDNVQSIAREYFDIRVAGALFWYAMLAGINFYKGTGDTRTAMWITLLVNGINIGLDVLLIFGIGPFPELAHQGAAIATVIATVVGAATVLTLFVRDHGRAISIRVSEARALLHIGLPMGVQWTLEIAAWSLIVVLMARLGDAELAANTIAIKIISVSFLPGHGLGDAAGVLTGRYAGAGRLDLVHRSYRSALTLGVGIMGFLALIFFAFPEALIMIFRNDADVLRIGSQLLYIAAFFQVLDAVAMITTGALNGTGDTRFTMWLTVISAWLVLVPLAWFLGIKQGLGARGAWYALTAHIACIAAGCIVRYLGGRWHYRVGVSKAAALTSNV